MAKGTSERIYTPEQIRTAEQIAMQQYGIPQELLMEHAAMAVANEICGADETYPATAAILAGPGNNGADGLATARLLTRRGLSVTVFEADSECRNEAYRKQRAMLQAYADEGVMFGRLTPDIDWDAFDFIIDGLFGIGCNRELTGTVRSTVLSLNAYTESFPEEMSQDMIPEGIEEDGTREYERLDRATVIAIDIPSGIDSRTGAVLGAAVRADCTVTFSAVKTGLSLYPGRGYAGFRVVADVGIPKAAMPETDMTVLSDTMPMLRRNPAGHKGTFGKTLLIAGSKTTPGAAVLAAKACYRSGAGMVKVVSDAEVLKELLASMPEVIVTERTQWLADPVKESAGYDVIVIGPGLGMDETARELFHRALAMEDKTFILDADALNILAMEANAEIAAVSSKSDTDNSIKPSFAQDLAERMKLLQEKLPKNTLLTPHPLELARLLGADAKEIAKDRLSVAEQWLACGEAVLIMKDAATLIAGDGRIRFNETGNDGMGTAGSGDVLAGICGALAWDARNGRRTLAECAAAAVTVHGTAGDLAARKYGTVSMTAGDMIETLPVVFGELQVVH